MGATQSQPRQILFDLARAVDPRPEAHKDRSDLGDDALLGRLEGSTLPPIAYDPRKDFVNNVVTYLEGITDLALVDPERNRDFILLLASIDSPVVTQKLFRYSLDKPDEKFTKYLIDTRIYSYDGFCGLCMTISRNKIDLAREYFSLESKMKYGRLPNTNRGLLTAVGIGNHVAVDMLLAEGGNVNYVNPISRVSVIVAAVGTGDLKMVKKIVNAGLDVQSEATYAALKSGVQDQRYDIVEFLLSQCCPMQDPKCTIEIVAAPLNDERMNGILEKYRNLRRAIKVEVSVPVPVTVQRKLKVLPPKGPPPPIVYQTPVGQQLIPPQLPQQPLQPGPGGVFYSPSNPPTGKAPRSLVS